MQHDHLLDLLKSPLHKTKVEQLAETASAESFSLKELIDLTFHSEEQVAFRAAWILEYVYCRCSERLLADAGYFLNRFHLQDNLSARRHYGKILALMTKKNAPQAVKQFIEGYETEQLVDIAFSWLIDDNVPVAIKSHCLNILANLSTKHNWIREELLQTMDFLVDKESVAFYAKVKQIRKQLK